MERVGCSSRGIVKEEVKVKKSGSKAGGARSDEPLPTTRFMEESLLQIVTEQGLRVDLFLISSFITPRTKNNRAESRNRYYLLLQLLPIGFNKAIILCIKCLVHRQGSWVQQK